MLQRLPLKEYRSLSLWAMVVCTCWEKDLRVGTDLLFWYNNSTRDRVDRLGFPVTSSDGAWFVYMILTLIGSCTQHKLGLQAEEGRHVAEQRRGVGKDCGGEAV